MTKRRKFSPKAIKQQNMLFLASRVMATQRRLRHLNNMVADCERNNAANQRLDRISRVVYAASELLLVMSGSAALGRWLGSMMVRRGIVMYSFSGGGVHMAATTRYIHELRVFGRVLGAVFVGGSARIIKMDVSATGMGNLFMSVIASGLMVDKLRQTIMVVRSLHAGIVGGLNAQYKKVAAVNKVQAALHAKASAESLSWTSKLWGNDKKLEADLNELAYRTLERDFVKRLLAVEVTIWKSLHRLDVSKMERMLKQRSRMLRNSRAR